MNGRRRYPDADNRVWPVEPGDYWQRADIGVRSGWYGVAPNGLSCNLAAHEVTEHEDGTVTVSPSILVRGANREGVELEWHGYLERGVWREC